MYSDEEIARICHDTSRALQFVQGDPLPSQPWDAEEDWIKEGLIRTVKMIRAGCTAEDIHEEWVRWRQSLGWEWGEEKNYDRKTHPCLVPYENLPRKQQDKNRVTHAIVKELS